MSIVLSEDQSIIYYLIQEYDQTFLAINHQIRILQKRRANDCLAQINYIYQGMADLRTTTIEENYPRVRRNTIVGINNILKNTLAQTFLNQVEEPQEDDSQQSIRESEQMILVHYKRIHNIIDTIDQHIMRRLENHENEVFSIVKDQIEELKEQTRVIIQRLNEAIAKKNTEDEIYHLNNEVDYFKNQTFRLFQQNKKLKQQNFELRNKLKEDEIELQNSSKVMQKLKRNCMKERIVKAKLHQSIKERISTLGKEETLDAGMIDQLFVTFKQDKRDHRRINTSGAERKDLRVVSKDSSIHIGCSSSLKDQSVLNAIQDYHEVSGESANANITLEKDLCLMPGIRMQKIDSELIYSPFISPHNSFYKAMENNDAKDSVLHFDKTESKDVGKLNVLEAVLAKDGNVGRLKNFFTKTLNKSSRPGEKRESVPYQTSQAKSGFKGRQIHYMSHAFNKGKMRVEEIVPNAAKSRSNAR